MKRTDVIITGNVYHVLNKSIAKYDIFPSKNDFERIIHAARFFSIKDNTLPKFSRFITQNQDKNNKIEKTLEERRTKDSAIVKIICYCIMPTHVHFVLKQEKENGISKFMGDVSNSYARYFNTKYNRKGRLWEGNFKNIAIDSNEQLLHLTRYIHLNPVTAKLTDKADNWNHSSYLEYIESEEVQHPLCDFKDVISIDPTEYGDFVHSRADYQKELAAIKNLKIE